MAKPIPSLLLCFDFDGTLVNHETDPQFHPALGDLLREFRRLGAAWVVNTGRSLSQTLAGLGQHHVFLMPDFIIAQECEIYRPGFFNSWTDFGSWNRRARAAHRSFIRQHAQLLGSVDHHISRLGHAEFLTGDLGQVGVVADNEAQMDDISGFIDTLCAREPEVSYHRNGRYLRFSHAGYSKGSALQELGRLLHVPHERIFAAGDNYNDLSMLDPCVAASIACPGNALPAIKNHVDELGGFVGESPASEGMLEALAHFYPHVAARLLIS